MEGALQAIEALPAVQYLRHARWSYAAVNAAHIAGLALLIGAILPLNLRLLGAWRDIPVPQLARVLVPAAAAGLALAVLTGVILFSVRASEYAVLPVVAIKLGLVGIGTIAALELHRRYGMTLEGASRRRLAAHAILSTTCWIGALTCGRLIAFVMD